LASDTLVVEVVKGTTEALIPGLVIAEGETIVGAHRKAGGPDGACLWRAVELELLVCCDVASSAKRVGQDTILQGDTELSVSLMHVLVARSLVKARLQLTLSSGMISNAASTSRLELELTLTGPIKKVPS
jgi:hypothetical protein